MKSVILTALFLFFSVSSHAESLLLPANSTLVAQENYDAYDPFADYSEFDEATEEEADIYFFKNGRFFTLGLIGGFEMFTDNLGQIYNNSPDFGILLAYFFDLRFAVQFSYVVAQHGFGFSVNNQQYSGTLGVNTLAFDIKYYLNVQNVTKGLADFNPYIFGGIAQISREQKTDGETEISKDSALGFQVGIGTEFPMMKNKIHLGLEALYEYVNFSGEGNNLVVNNVKTSTKPNGDVIRMQAILGFNF